jgi:5-aminolevulinate synthase
MDYNSFFTSSIARLKAEGRYRVFAALERKVGAFPRAVLHAGTRTREVTIWCSNDYLGMGHHPAVLAAMQGALAASGAGAGGTRNIGGTTHLHVQLEAELSDLHGKDAALLFNSGYMSNWGTISTLAAHLPGCVIFSDRNNHASMIEGARHSGAARVVFAHNDATDLEAKLAAVPRDVPKLVMFESVYSMDGDIAPLEALASTAKAHGALTYLDEVHAVGLYGARGGGISQRDGVEHLFDVIEGTLGKAYGVMGGYIAGSASLIDFVRSHSSGFIFSTALSPVLAAGALASIRHLKTSSTERDLQRVQVALLRAQLDERGIPHMANPGHIVPVMIGDAARCKAISDALLERFDIYLQPINYPTVPRGTERLRITPSPLHSAQDVAHLVGALDAIWRENGMQRAA